MGTSGEQRAGFGEPRAISKLGATVPDSWPTWCTRSSRARSWLPAACWALEAGALLCALGEIVMAFSLNMTVLIWGGRVLVGLELASMIPSVLAGLKIYHGKNRVCTAASASSGLLRCCP